MRPFILRLLAAAALLWGWGCEGGGNSGSETTNGLSGRVRDTGGSPVAHARVHLLPEDFDPGAGAAPAARTATDAGGAYSLRDVLPGRYHLEIIDSAGGTVALLQGILVAEAGRIERDATVERGGAIDVRVADFLGGAEGYVYLPGTSVWRTVDAAARASGRVRLERVPAGRFAELLLAESGASGPRLISLAREVDVRPNDTVFPAPFQTWKASRTLPLNTLAMGIAETITDFPLLVRLDSGTFDFSAARPDGGDLRFSTTGGTPLPFQIERWDAAARRAEVWVRIDTVRGNDAGQVVLMHWGRDLAGLPGGQAVFDTASGFAAVYHLAEDPNSDPGGYRDATPNANHATAAPGGSEGRVPGVSASAKAFAAAPGSTAGTLSAGMPPGFGGNASFTVSFWMRGAPLPERQVILDFGGYGTHQAVHWLLRSDTTAQFGAYDHESVGRVTAPWQNVFRFPLVFGGWTHVATVYDAARATLITYVDGAQADSVSSPALAVDKAGGLRIGKALPEDINTPGRPFSGSLDEVRFVTRAVTPARVKLDYLTQKP